MVSATVMRVAAAVPAATAARPSARRPGASVAARVAPKRAVVAARAAAPLRPSRAALATLARATRGRVAVQAAAAEAPPSIDWVEGDPSNYTIGILGDLHVDPRDLDHTYEGRDHMKAILTSSPNPFLVSLGDLGESKDCTESKQLYAGTSDCFKLVREYLDGFEVG